LKLVWLDDAITERDAIFEYIAADNLRAAVTVDSRIEDQVEGLLEHPMRGRPGRVPMTRELVIVGTSYVVVYRIHRRMLIIMSVLHGAQRWPPGAAQD
jgi:toxin ParE1/3/4